MRLDESPTFCAACHQQKPDEPYIDFEAAYDGPVLEGVVGGIKPQIDDLSICMTCILGAAGLLPKSLEERREIRSLTAELEQERARAEGAEKFAASLKTALEDKPTPPSAPAPRPPRPVAA